MPRKRVANGLFRAIEILLALCLFAMVVMVFGNVVLRYGFNSGITVSEELSRIFFVWLTFIGAIVAMRDGTHLGMTNMVEKLSRKGKLVCAAICQVIIIAMCALLVHGTAQQHDINQTTLAPVTGMSMIWVFGVTYLTGGAMVLLALRKLWRILTGQVSDAELIEVTDHDEPNHEPISKEVRA